MTRPNPLRAVQSDDTSTLEDQIRAIIARIDQRTRMQRVDEAALLLLSRRFADEHCEPMRPTINDLRRRLMGENSC